MIKNQDLPTKCQSCFNVGRVGIISHCQFYWDLSLPESVLCDLNRVVQLSANEFDCHAFQPMLKGEGVGISVKQWLEEHQEQIEVFHLPSYSPELNPDECLNGNLKNKAHSGKPVRNREDLEKKTRSFMRTLLKRPAHVKNYFKHPKVAYAA